MNKSFQSTLGALALGFALSTSAWAQPAGSGGLSTQSSPGASPATLGPIIKTEPIPYATGGIAEMGQERMKALRDQYNMHLTFAQGKEGAFLADVKVKIADAKGGTVLEAVSGPMLFAKVPAGTYQVSAEVAGKTQTQKVQVGGKGAKDVVMRFPG